VFTDAAGSHREGGSGIRKDLRATKPGQTRKAPEGGGSNATAIE